MAFQTNAASAYCFYCIVLCTTSIILFTFVFSSFQFQSVKYSFSEVVIFSSMLPREKMKDGGRMEGREEGRDGGTDESN